VNSPPFIDIWLAYNVAAKPKKLYTLNTNTLKQPAKRRQSKGIDIFVLIIFKIAETFHSDFAPGNSVDVI